MKVSLLLILILVLVTACAPADNLGGARTSSTTRQVEGNRDCIYVDPVYAKVCSVTLSDGTRCVVMDGSESGALACDWSKTQ